MNIFEKLKLRIEKIGKKNHKSFMKETTKNNNFIQEIRLNTAIAKVKRRWTKSEILNTIIASISCITMVILLLTLFEMQIERDSAYRPTIVLDSLDYSFGWNESGLQYWVSEYQNFQIIDMVDFSKVDTNNVFDISNIDKKYMLEFLKEDDGDEDVNISETIPCYAAEGYVLTKIYFGNIGIGTAKNVTFTWLESNREDLNNYLIFCNPTKVNFFNNQYFVFNFGEFYLHAETSETARFMYIRPNDDERHYIEVPIQYSLLLNQICIEGNIQLKEAPKLHLQVSYEDIQGKKYSSLFLIQIVFRSANYNDDGSGLACYKLFPIDTDSFVNE